MTATSTSTETRFSPTKQAKIISRKVKAVASVLVIVLLVWMLKGLFFSQANTGLQNSEKADYYLAKRSSFDLTIMATGELDTHKKVELKSKVEGRVAITEVVDEGVSVKEGDVLVRLADEAIRDKIENERLNVEQAKSDSVAAEQNLEIEKSEAQSGLKQAQVKLQLAQLDYDKWLKGDVPTKKRELGLKLKEAEKKLARAKRDFQSSVILHKERFISANEMEDDELAVERADNELMTAKLDTEIYSLYTHPREKSKFESDLQQAQAELDRTQRKNVSKLAQATSKLQSRSRTLRIRQDRLDKLELQLQYTVIKAPQNGLVVYGTSMGRRRGGNQTPIAQGREVHHNETLIVLPDTSNMVAVVKVHEAMVAQLKIDQQVDLSIDALPGVLLLGKISQIGVMAKDGGWWNRDLREYEVRIAIPNTSKDGKPVQLKPAMRCSATIITGRAKDVIAVPVQAVLTEDQSQFCYVKEGSQIQRRKLKTGRTSDTQVEILQGLQEGDLVLIRKPKPGEIG